MKRMSFQNPSGTPYQFRIEVREEWTDTWLKIPRVCVSDGPLCRFFFSLSIDNQVSVHSSLIRYLVFHSRPKCSNTRHVYTSYQGRILDGRGRWVIQVGRIYIATLMWDTVFGQTLVNRAEYWILQIIIENKLYASLYLLCHLMSNFLWGMQKHHFCHLIFRYMDGTSYGTTQLCNIYTVHI